MWTQATSTGKRHTKSCQKPSYSIDETSRLFIYLIFFGGPIFEVGLFLSNVTYLLRWGFNFQPKIAKY